MSELTPYNPDPFFETTERPPVGPIEHDFLSSEDATATLLDNIAWSDQLGEAVQREMAEAGLDLDFSQPLSESDQKALEENVRSRHQEAASLFEFASEILDESKTQVVDTLTQIASGFGLDVDVLKSSLESRLNHIKGIGVSDYILQGKSMDLSRGAATYEKREGIISLNYKTTREEAAALNLSVEEVARRNLLHELLHASSYSGFIEFDSGGIYHIKSGLASMAGYGEQTEIRQWHGNELMDEGAQEQLRWKHLDGTVPSYERSVMFWDMMDKLDPEIPRLRFEAKFQNKGRGELVGRVENILGPNAIEDLEDFLLETKNLRRTFPAWKDMIIERTQAPEGVNSQETRELREKALNALNISQKRMFAQRGITDTDEELRALYLHGEDK